MVRRLLTFLLLLTSASLSADEYDVSTWLVATSSDLEGWTVEGGWKLNTGAGGSHKNSVDGSSLVAPFIENWHNSSYGPLEDCSLSQVLTNLPAGKYMLKADMMAVRQAYGNVANTPATHVTLFANDATLSIATGNDPPKRFEMNFELNVAGHVEIGVRASSTNANWIAIDNIVLYFQGTAEELIAGEKEKVKAELEKYYTAAEIEAMMATAGNSFEQLEALRNSVKYMSEKSPLDDAAKNLTIGNHSIQYVSDLALALCTIPYSAFGTDYSVSINYDKAEGWDDLTIDGTSVASGSDYTFENVAGGKNYLLSFKNSQDGTTIHLPVTFTSLPVVCISGSFSDTYSQGTFLVQDGTSAQPELLNMKAKWRGGITNLPGKHKRNYHVKLLDDAGEKLERKFFGLRNDNSWILESCQVDMLRMRNRILTDLWNDFSVKPYYASQEPKAKTGTRGRFVELILNSKYRGIYCMTENMDRKQLKLKKYDEEKGTIHGQLWKSKDWSYAVFMGHDYNSNYYPGTSPVNYNNNREMWDSYQVKYPDLEDVSPTNWQVLYDAVNFVCTSSNAEFKAGVESYFDMPLLIDYYVLMETILSSDNHGKNMFFVVYDKTVDKKITFAVWDMDTTIGQRWSNDYYHSDIMKPEQDYATYITQNEHGDYNLFRRLRQTDAGDFNTKVRLRYRDLRQNYLATDAIIKRFEQQVAEFKTAGAAARESAKWSYDSDVSGKKIDFDVEMDYLRNWIIKRMNYLDQTRFHIDLLPADIEGVQVLPAKTTLDIFDIRGKKLATTPVSVAQDVLSRLPAGIYIVDGKKVVVGR